MSEKRSLHIESSGPSGSSKRIRMDAKDAPSASNAPESVPVDPASDSTAPHEGAVNDTSTTVDHSPEDSGKKKSQPDKKHKKNAGRRSRKGEEGRERSSDGPKEPRLPKRQSALMIGFCGSRYRGMQFQKSQPGIPAPPTIEKALFDALIAAGAVSKDNADDPVKVNFARAARTDAGVHAVGNVVSMKMIMSVPGVDDMRAHINSMLPPDIRLWDFQRVQGSFNARTLCDGRKYTYFFPSYLLIPPKPESPLDRVLRKHASAIECEVPYLNDPFWTAVNSATSSPQEDMVRKRVWRATPAHLERLREIVKKFEKTHNFHNFTVTKDPKDKANQRYMKKLEVAEAAVYGDTEWIAISLDGQSFVLHQRKMIFALVMLCRTGTPASTIDELYGLTTVHIPKMPALGLLLEHPVYELYNTRMARAQLDPSHTDYRPPIDFERYSEEMTAFKQKYIYDNMRHIEDRKGLFDAWIRTVDSYGGTDFLWLNPKGAIPPEAVITKGERRQDPFRERKVFNMTSFAEDDNAKVEVEAQDEDEDVEEPLTKQQMEEAEG